MWNLFKVNKILEWLHWRGFVFANVNFEQILHNVLVFPLLNSSAQRVAGTLGKPSKATTWSKQLLWLYVEEDAILLKYYFNTSYQLLQIWLDDPFMHRLFWTMSLVYLTFHLIDSVTLVARIFTEQLRYSAKVSNQELTLSRLAWPGRVAISFSDLLQKCQSVSMFSLANTHLLTILFCV